LAKVWLVITFNTTTIPPVITNVGIYTGPISSLTLLPSGEAMAEVMSIEGDDSADAKKKLEEFVRNNMHMRWAWIWINPSQVAYNARYRLKKYIDSQVEGLENETIMFQDTYSDYDQLSRDDERIHIANKFDESDIDY
jgi:hypothetical protein